MKSFLFTLAFICLAICSDVLVLDNNNFDENVLGQDLILVEFYAPWCGHCKSLEPHYEAAATKLKESNIPIAKVNADEDVNKPLAEKYGVRGFPTLKVFRKGVPSEYGGERSTESIVSYMKKQNMPSVTDLNSVSAVEAFVTQERVVVVGFFDKKEGSDYSFFSGLADKLRNQRFLFGVVAGNHEVANHFKAVGEHSHINSVVLFKQFDEGRNDFSGSFEELESFVTKHSIPLIDEIGPENYRNYIETGIPLGYLFVDLTVAGQKEKYIEIIRDAAKASKGKVNWVYIDYSKYAKHGERVGLSGNVVPAIAIDLASQNKHWGFDETATITKEAIDAWVAKYLSGELDPTVKSEEIPADNSGPVTKLVAKNFNNIVMDTSKDVLVEFYAPWCGHCKSLAPIYEKLGEHYKSNDKIVIAQIDATANDVDPIHDVRGFPTIKFFPATFKDGLNYEGERTLEAFINYIEQNAATKLAENKDKDEL